MIDVLSLGLLVLTEVCHFLWALTTDDELNIIVLPKEQFISNGFDQII